MLVTNRDDSWNVLNLQHITPNSQRWDYSDILGGGQKRVKESAHMVEGDHHLRKAPKPTRSLTLSQTSVRYIGEAMCKFECMQS